MREKGEVERKVVVGRVEIRRERRRREGERERDMVGEGKERAGKSELELFGHSGNSSSSTGISMRKNGYLPGESVHAYSTHSEVFQLFDFINSSRFCCSAVVGKTVVDLLPKKFCQLGRKPASIGNEPSENKAHISRLLVEQACPE